MNPLPGLPSVPLAMRRRLDLDWERFRAGLPDDMRGFVRDRYALDLTGEYAGRSIRLPFGKASGQLSMTGAEVRADADAGLGFVVLKTVIAQDPSGARTMAEWAIHESAMRVERRLSAAGREGWTVTWKGRGWDRGFDDYLALYREALETGAAAGMPVAASVKYHLPAGEEPFREAEYDHTTAALVAMGGAGTIIEKDFSPTLAGDDRAGEGATILRWVREVPGRIKRHAGVVLGMKLMNSRFDDDFQAEMSVAAAAAGPDFLVCYNRLFDPALGVAYGGWDLSDRNLRVLELLRAADSVRPTVPPSHRPTGSIGPSVRPSVGPSFGPTVPLSHRPTVSATGNIVSGRMMAEYARRGATSGQIHTLFQLPLGAYHATAGSRTARALHTLLFDPAEGLIAWLLHLGESGAVERRDGLIHFLDIARRT